VKEIVNTDARYTRKIASTVGISLRAAFDLKIRQICAGWFSHLQMSRKNLAYNSLRCC
jgi:hypothetical protein